MCSDSGLARSLIIQRHEVATDLPCLNMIGRGALCVKVDCESSRQLKTRFGLCENVLAVERDYASVCGASRSALGYMVKHLSASGGCLGS